MNDQTKLRGIVSAAGVAMVGVMGILQGCSNGDPFVQELNPPENTTPVASTGAVISGSASKGILRNADCIATDTAGNELYSSVGETDACTNSRGRYSFQLLSNPTTPVVVTIQARTGTQMLCDYPSGCGNGVAFNNPLDLASDFSLRAVVPSIASTATTQEVNVSPWTEIATARAVSSATTLSSLTTTQVQSAYTEVASVLNNVLSLEGNANDAFDGDFFSIDLVDLANPDQDTDIDSGEERKATLLSLASASLFNLVDTAGTTNTNITSVVQNLATSFQSDGQFNVNNTADGRAESDTVNLASIVSGISNVAQNIQTQLSSTAATQLTNFLSVSDLTTELASIESTASTLAELKNAVTNVLLDTTKPVDLKTLVSLDDFNKATGLLRNLKNALTATVAAFNTDEGANTVLEDVGDVFDLTTVNYDDALLVISELTEAAASMILAVSEQDVSVYTTAGCTLDGTNAAVTSLSCTLPQLGHTLDDPIPDILNGTGTLVYTGSSNSVANSGTVTVGSETYEITLVGTNPTGSTPLFTLTKATANLEPSDTTNPQTITFGETSTLSGSVSNSTLQSFTLNAQDVTIAVDAFTLVADVLATRDATLRDTLITNFNLTGSLTLASSISSTLVADSNEGAAIAFRLAFQGVRDGLASTTQTTLPMPTEETEDNFIAANNVLVRLETPVTYTKSTSLNATAEATEKLIISLRGARNAVKNGVLTAAVIRLTNLTVDDAATNGVVNDVINAGLVFATVNNEETSTWTFSDGTGTAKIGITFTDSNGTSTASGTVTVVSSAGENRSFGSVSTQGTVSITDPDDQNNAASLSLPAAIFQ